MLVRTTLALLLLSSCGRRDDSQGVPITSNAPLDETSNANKAKAPALDGTKAANNTNSATWWLKDVSLEDVSLNKQPIEKVAFDGFALKGTLNKKPIAGTTFVGATFQASLYSGEKLSIRIAEIASLSGENSDVFTYDIRLDREDKHPVCGYEPDGTTAKRALLVPGSWDKLGAWSNTGAVTNACRQAAIAKCVEFGYKSWKGHADTHHACVRMLRADYCGDGQTHTVDGTLIKMFDKATFQKRTADDVPWPVDAEWNADGAICFNAHRGTKAPACSEKKLKSCGSFSRGALLISEFNGPVVD
jgi:hypothetical protein